MGRWLIWGGIIIAWTVALEVPVPISPPDPDAEFVVTPRIVFSKSVHVAAYAFLTVLSAWVAVPVRYRWLMMFFLTTHAMATEVLQDQLHEFCGRGGSIYDVGLDHIGIIIGFALAWKLWTRPDP